MMVTDNQAILKMISAGLWVKWQLCGEMRGVQQVVEMYVVDNDVDMFWPCAGHRESDSL